MDYRELGRRIKEERLKQNITQEQIAEASNISAIHVSHVENGSTKLSLEALVNICNALKINPDKVLLDSIYTSKEYLKDEIALLLKDCSDKEINIISKLIKLYLQER
jgi:transcriptional regulator with XRE-family HTH domain